MDKNQLSKSLQELHDALENTDSISLADRQRLERLHADIHEKLEQGQLAEEDDDTLVEELVEAIQEFEVAHPQITLALGRLMAILSGSGV